LLIKLLRTHLRPYKRELTYVVLLQFVGTLASLYLPRLNADIIDKGIVTGDTDYILRTGGWMLLVTAIQVVCSIIAVHFGSRAAMSFGRDLRGAIFHRVGEFSGREVGRFGAPSLITRTTNDVQQVQMLVVITCTMLVAAPIMCVGGIIFALREDLGLSWLMLVCVPVMALIVFKYEIGSSRAQGTSRPGRLRRPKLGISSADGPPGIAGQDPGQPWPVSRCRTTGALGGGTGRADRHAGRACRHPARVLSHPRRGRPNLRNTFRRYAARPDHRKGNLPGV